MKPEAVEKWDTSELAEILGSTMQKPVLSAEDHFRITEAAEKLPGVGQYSKEHIFRTACLVAGKKHPSTEFVVMGSGTNYEPLYREGIMNMNDLNSKWDISMDAGELAYHVCMLKK